MKAGIAAILEAIIETDLTKIKNGITLYFTYDEERTFCGVNELIKKNSRIL